jgi:hypothetical protein
VFPTHSNGVCILTPNQAFQLESNGIVPDCREHRHLSRGRADQLIEEHIVFRDDQGDYVRYTEARWVGRGKRYLTFVRSREWKRMDSAGTTCMQLVPAGGAW